MDESTDKQAPASELAELRAENERLRAALGVGRTPSPVEAEVEKERRPMRVLIVPAPREPDEGNEGPPPAAIAKVARIVLEHQRRSRPEEEWLAEFDLSRVAPEALCYRLNEVVRKVWDGSGPLPATFLVEEDEQGAPRLRRQLVGGEPESERFRKLNDALLGAVTEVLAEGEAAEEAGAHHHAHWSLKAADVMLARQKLAFVLFSGGEAGWHEILSEPRPEYEPRGAISG
jgi:hypothetical protein